MAGSKEIKKRIKTVGNTRKITKTMEMVATAKSKRMVDRINAAKPYGEKMADIMDGLGALKDELDSPFLRRVAPKKVTLIVVTANRGLCGGYNSSVLKLARRRILAHQEAGREVELHVLGKKGVTLFRFLKIPVHKSHIDIDDSLQYPRARELAEAFMADFTAEKTDLVEVISTVYYSSSRQRAENWNLMPIGAATDADSAPKKPGAGAGLLYEPDAESILTELLPHLVKNLFYRRLLEAITSEQIARRIAMKSATDNAGEMNKLLTRKYNRVRQASITQELAEIVAGADAT